MATIGRNDACLCGSGKKYKKCCLAAPPGEAMRKREYALLDAVVEYLMSHSRCADASGGQFRCTDAFRAFILGLREQHADLEIEHFAELSRVPLYALKAWLAGEMSSLEELSSSVVNLLDQRRMDEALAVCERIQREYPESLGILQRVALVHEARGEWALAASYHRRALAFIDLPDQRDSFDDALRADLRERLAHARACVDAV